MRQCVRCRQSRTRPGWSAVTAPSLIRGQGGNLRGGQGRDLASLLRAPQCQPSIQFSGSAPWSGSTASCAEVNAAETCVESQAPRHLRRWSAPRRAGRWSRRLRSASVVKGGNLTPVAMAANWPGGQHRCLGRGQGGGNLRRVSSPCQGRRGHAQPDLCRGQHGGQRMRWSGPATWAEDMAAT